MSWQFVQTQSSTMAAEPEYRSFSFLKGILWVAWIAIALPVRVVFEGLLFSRPQQYILPVIVRDWRSVVTGVLGGGLIGVVWIVLASIPGLVSPGIICSSYLTMFGYLTGCVVSYASIRNRWFEPVRMHYRVESSRVVLALTEGGYIGTLIGLLVAYPVASSEAPVPRGAATNTPDWDDWCRPHDSVHVWIPIVVAFGCALVLGLVKPSVIAVNVDIPAVVPKRNTRTTRHNRRTGLGSGSDSDDTYDWGQPRLGDREMCRPAL